MGQTTTTPDPRGPADADLLREGIARLSRTPMPRGDESLASFVAAGVSLLGALFRILWDRMTEDEQVLSAIDAIREGDFGSVSSQLFSLLRFSGLMETVDGVPEADRTFVRRQIDAFLSVFQIDPANPATMTEIAVVLREWGRYLRQSDQPVDAAELAALVRAVRGLGASAPVLLAALADEPDRPRSP